MPRLPKSKYRIKQTGGNTFFDANGSYYRGPYIELNNGTYFKGQDPGNISPNNQLYTSSPQEIGELEDNIVPLNRYSQNHISVYNKLDKIFPIISTKSIPKKNDRERGYFKRFFAIRNNTNEYLEIDFETYNEILYKTGKYDYHLYSIGEIFWHLNQDSEDKNKEELESVKFIYPQIEEFFTNLVEFQNSLEEQIHPNQGRKNKIKDRKYLDGNDIPTNLPKSYAYAPLDKNRVGQKCSNCAYWNASNNNCKKWKAEVRKVYWCVSWKAIAKPSPLGIRPTYDKFGNPVFPAKEVTKRDKRQSTQAQQRQVRRRTPLRRQSPSRGGSGY